MCYMADCKSYQVILCGALNYFILQWEVEFSDSLLPSIPIVRSSKLYP